MTEFIYNNMKNTSTSHISLKLINGYHLYAFYKKDINICFLSKSANVLANELKKLMIIWIKIFHHAHNLQKRHHNKATKLGNYAPSNKV